MLYVLTSTYMAVNIIMIVTSYNHQIITVLILVIAFNMLCIHDK